jgi:hypothetical protein
MEKPRKLAPIGEIIIETTKFVPQAMENPEIAGIEYQRGTLTGYTVRARALEKCGYKCVY